MYDTQLASQARLDGLEAVILERLANHEPLSCFHCQQEVGDDFMVMDYPLKQTSGQLETGMITHRTTVICGAIKCKQACLDESAI